MGDPFSKVGASCGSITCAFIIDTCLIGETALSEMLRQQLRFAFGHGGEMLLQRPRNPLMNLLTPSTQKVVVSDVTHQRMFEAVAQFARPGLRKCQTGVNETRNSRRDVTRGSTSHRLQERIRKLLPNHGRDLGNLLCWPESIEPRQQRILQSSGHDRPIGRRRFHDGFGQLFDEEWYTLGLG